MDFKFGCKVTENKWIMQIFYTFMNEYLVKNHIFMNECLAENYIFMNVMGALAGLGIVQQRFDLFVKALQTLQTLHILE